MTTRETPWPAGTPCWVDLTAHDLAATQAFYTQLLGWSYTESNDEFMGYCNAMAEGAPVAGLSPTPPGMPDDAPRAWTVYLATDDLAATHAAMTENGATVVAEPMAVGALGSMALWVDPVGAFVGAWQSGEHTGFRRFDEAGAVAWIDLMTSDPEGAEGFYATVFGFTYDSMGVEGMQYVMFTVPGGERPAGGIGHDTNLPPGLSAWSVCFQHPDVDAAASQITELGGQVIEAPFDFQFGRLVIASGLDGEVFSLMTPVVA